MPQAAIIALTFGDSKCASRKSRGLASRRRPRSRSDCVPLARHADHKVAHGCEGRHGRTEQAEDVRRFLAKAREHRPPGRGVLRRQRRDRSCGLLEILADAKIGVVAKDARETVGGGRESKTLRNKLVFMGGEERRSRKQGEVHRAEVVAEAGQGDFAGLDRAAGLGRLLDHRDRPAAAQEVDRGGEAVMSRADDDGVESVHPAFWSPPISRQMHISLAAARRYVQRLPRAMLEPGKSARDVPTSSQRLLASAYSWAMVGRRSRNQFDGTRMRRGNCRGAVEMSANKALSDFAAALLSGSIKVVDLTAPL